MRVRFWIGIFATVCLVVCVLALILLTPGAHAGPGTVIANPASGGAAPSSDLQPQNYEGMLTDTHCGAKHSAAVGLSAADCTRACIHTGEHFALVDGEKTYVLEGDQAALKRVSGQRVKIVGSLTGSTISVSSVQTPGS